MGRKRAASFKIPDPLSRHRFADSKYRHNVQFFYSLLRDTTDENHTKDVLLKKISNDIKKMCDDIVHLAGSQTLMKCNEDFLRIVELGENVWKEEKNPVHWWNQMQEVFKHVMKEKRV